MFSLRNSFRAATVTRTSVVARPAAASRVRSIQTQTGAATESKGVRERSGLSSEQLIAMEDKYSAHNYHPLPIVFEEAHGVEVKDPEGKEYIDFLAAYSATNQGHSHPKIVRTLQEQAPRLALSSRAFHNSLFPQFAKYVTSLFKFDRVLPMNTGAEAVETALKLARRWGYLKKGIPENEAVIVCCKGCFHGRTLAVISLSDDPESYGHFGPFLPGIEKVEYGNLDDLNSVLERLGDRVAGFLIEPVQGEAGVVIPPDGFLKDAKALCEKHNVLFIADEIQSGLGRTGKMSAVDWDGVRPDVLILGKALSGGLYPVSAVLADDDVMGVISPGTHGSTYGGNPLGCAVALSALEVLVEENLVENSLTLGEYLRERIDAIRPSWLVEVRGRGLMNAIVIDPSFNVSAWNICLMLKENGLLAKPTHDNIIRLTPPLSITKEQIDKAVTILDTVFKQADAESKKSQ